MTKKFVAIPEGKAIRVSAGNYLFIGPQFINLADKFNLPATYTDGELLLYVDEKVMPNVSEPNLEISNAPPSIDSPQGGSKRKDSGASSGDMRTVSFVPKRTRKDNGTEGVHGKRLDASEHGIGRRAYLPSDANPKSTPEASPEGGLDSSAVGDKAKRVRKPKGDVGAATVDRDT